MLEKQQRIQAIMQALCTQGVGTLETAGIERISQLAKADLVTQMVVEQDIDMVKVLKRKKLLSIKKLLRQLELLQLK